MTPAKTFDSLCKNLFMVVQSPSPPSHERFTSFTNDDIITSPDPNDRAICFVEASSLGTSCFLFSNHPCRETRATFTGSPKKGEGACAAKRL
jgi:hypothetical protein